MRADDAELFHLVDHSAGARVADLQAALYQRGRSLSCLDNALDGFLDLGIVFAVVLVRVTAA